MVSLGLLRFHVISISAPRNPNDYFYLFSPFIIERLDALQADNTEFIERLDEAQANSMENSKRITENEKNIAIMVEENNKEREQRAKDNEQREKDREADTLKFNQLLTGQLQLSGQVGTHTLQIGQLQQGQNFFGGLCTNLDQRVTHLEEAKKASEEPKEPSIDAPQIVFGNISVALNPVSKDSNGK